MSNLNDLRSLLGRCTVRITLSNKPNERGTGFFVAPGTILTCAHVVENAQTNKAPVLVSWEGQTYTASIEKFFDKTYPDLALLKINQPVQHPCVYLHDDTQTDDKLYSFGYTDNYPDGDPATFVCEGFTSGSQPLIRFKFGEVRAGLSGGPLLNERTGSVCGVVKRTRGPDTIMGGRAIPTSTIFRELPDLSGTQQQFHTHDKRWYDAMTIEQHKESEIKNRLSLTGTSGAIEVFFLYADVEEDKRWINKFEKHLALLQKQELITTWHKDKLEPGGDVKTFMSEHLRTASIILLMVSSDFMDYYRESTDVEKALRMRKEGARVIPIILRASDWETSSFGGIQPLPYNRKPIKNWKDDDQAFLEVTQGLRKVVIELAKEKRSV